MPELASGTAGEVDVSRIVARGRGTDQGRTMQARLSAVQRALFLLPIASLAFAILARPHPENRAFTHALEEVTAFRAAFDRAGLEKLLRDYAQGQGMLPLTTVSDGASFGGKPLAVAENTEAIRPLAVVSLATLSDAQHHARPESALGIGVPDVSSLGAALTWRLAQTELGQAPTLKTVTLSPATVNEADVTLEREVAELQQGRRAAEAAVTTATQRLEAEQNLFDARRKRGLAWKIIVKSIEARDAAKVVLNEKTQALTDISGRYEEAVKRALAPREKLQLTDVPAFAIARVELEGGVGPYEIPVRLESRMVPVPALRQANFEQTVQAGLWDKVKGLDPEQAVQAVRDEFNWHNRYVEVAGLRVGGMTLLQVLPCLLPLLMLLLRRRLRAAAASYSLFGTKIYGDMPTLGFRSRSLEGLALIALPLIACVSAGLALLLIGQPPLLPALAALASLMLGSAAYAKIGELQGLVASVVHSHSYPPPEA
jgi:hypothetical protein